MNNKGLIFKWVNKGFGNSLLLAQATKIAIDNDIDAIFSGPSHIEELVDVPLYEKNRNYTDYILFNGIIYNTPKNPNCEIPVVIEYIRRMEEITGKKVKVNYDNYYIPVKFWEIGSVPSVDVTLCTKTGRWTPYRNWPYFRELKKLLDENNISYIDLNEEKMFNVECLNYVKKSRLYIGLDTGMTHYVSKFAMCKSLIIQSGFGSFSFWSSFYDFDYINYDVPCQPCYISLPWIRRGIDCKRDHECMKFITPEMVFERILEKI